MKLTLSKDKNLIVAELSGAFRGSPAERDAYWNDVSALSRKRGGVGFAFDKSGSETGTPCTWFCRAKQADKCVPLIDYCDDAVKALVQPILDRINGSRATTGDFDAPAPEGLAYMPFQKAGIEYLVNSSDVLLADDMGLGKQQPVDTHVLTPTGWTTIGSLRVGDRVIGSDGHPVNVVGVFPQGVKPSYRVTFSDESRVESGPEHLWTVKYWRGGRTLSDLTLTTQQLLDRPTIELSHEKGRATKLNLEGVKLQLPMLSGPARFGAAAELPVPAYVLGVLIANGGLRGSSAVATVNAADLDEIVENIVKAGAEIGAIQTYDNASRTVILETIRSIRELGLDVGSKDKRIPRQYLESSPAQRIALLQGLMDCDGGCSAERNRLTYHTTSRSLACDVQELVECLGGIASVHEYDRSSEGKPTEYPVRIRLPKTIAPFTIRRKVSKYNPGKHAHPVRTVKSVEYVRDVESVCISVDAADRLYVTEHAILTHNTIQVLGAVNADKSVRKVLVVCPPSVRLNWKREAEKWLVGDWTIQVVNGNKTIDPRANFVICGWSNLSQKNVRPGLMNYSWDVAVWDEAHYGKNTRTATRAKIAFGYWDSGKRREVEGVAHRANRNYFLTGTPCPNRPKELYAMLRHLDPKGLGRGYKKYTRRYCGAHQGRWGWVDDGATNLDELQRIMRSKFMLRRMKSEVLTELPGKIRTVVRLDPSDVKGASRILARQRKLLSDAGISLEDINEGNAEEAISELRGSPALFEEMSKLRAEIGSLKIKHAAEFADQVLSGNKKVIVFAHHRDVQDQVAAALSEYGVVQVQGGMDDAAKQESIDRFQNDDGIRVFVGSIQACREGITLTEATSVVFAELPWRPGDVDQAEDRANRIGQTQCVNSYYIVVDESLDAYIAETIAKKARNIDAALNSRKAEAPVDLGDHADAKPKKAEKANIYDLSRLPESELAVAPF